MALSQVTLKARTVKTATAKRKTPGATGACQRPARFVQAGNHMASSTLCRVSTIGKSHCKFPKFISGSFTDCGGPDPVGQLCRGCRPLADVPNSNPCHSIRVDRKSTRLNSSHLGISYA